MAAFLDPYVVLFHGYSEKNLFKAHCQFSAYLGRGLGGKVADPLVSARTSLTGRLILVGRQAPPFLNLRRIRHMQGGMDQNFATYCRLFIIKRVFHFVVNSGTALRPMLSENTSAK